MDATLFSVRSRSSDRPLPALRRIHGTILLPQWIAQDGSKTVLYQNEHLDEMRACRDAGPTYPIYVVPESAAIHLVEFMGIDNEDVIATGPENLPADYIQRHN